MELHVRLSKVRKVDSSAFVQTRSGREGQSWLRIDAEEEFERGRSPLLRMSRRPLSPWGVVQPPAPVLCGCHLFFVSEGARALPKPPLLGLPQEGLRSVKSFIAPILGLDVSAVRDMLATLIRSVVTSVLL